MMKKCILLTAVLAAGVFASCTGELDSRGVPTGPSDGNLRTKIVKLGDEFDSGVLLVKLESAEAGQVLACTEGVASVEKLFKPFPGKEALEARFGLDRWFVATLDGEVSIDEASERLAALDVVTAVEYSCTATR